MTPKRFKAISPFHEGLRSLGFNTYRDYLLSAKWAEIRTKVFDAKGYNCLRCGRKATQVHHQQYSLPVMMGLDITPLVPICRACHDKEHGIVRQRHPKKPKRPTQVAKKRRNRQPPSPPGHKWNKKSKNAIERIERAIAKGLNIRAYGATDAVCEAIERGDDWRPIIAAIEANAKPRQRKKKHRKKKRAYGSD